MSSLRKGRFLVKFVGFCEDWDQNGEKTNEMKVAIFALRD